MLTMARVTGGGAHELTLWCQVKFWFPYLLVVGLLLWAWKRPFGC